MVENCVAGYNSCMFAYGQTGSGKTHTMLGDIEGGTRRSSVNCGMTPRVFEYLFSRIQKEKETRRDEKLRFTCKCSFLEIYNEQIFDLLDPSSVNLQIREDAKKGVYVENLTEYEVSTARDATQQLIQGAANRKVASTNMNRASSRSHSVFTCVIESKWECQGVVHHRFARLNLVDLAGSERQKSSGAEGERLKEATNINKSLSTLGLVIMNLIGVSNKKSLHVPYRDSKLTFLLQDSLGGNSKTIIIANISPSNCCALETLSTLKFAQRAKYIRNNAVVNEDASGDVLSMRIQIQQLKKEVNHLRALAKDGSEKIDGDGLSGTLVESPCSFKLDGGQGSFSPLTFDKRLSQRKEYEAALVAAFRREQDKEAKLKAMTAGKQAAEQLASQRTEEVRSLKMRLRFREEGIKRLEAVASGKLLAEAHILQEKEELLKELEVTRNQLDRNPEITRFAMENLHLKEELKRLQAFVEEGEREMMHEQITVLQDKLLEALDWKLMHDKGPDVQDLSLSWETSNEENEFLRLQAIQNEREIEALRKNLSFCLEAKEKLESHVDELVAQLEEQKTSRFTNEVVKEDLQTTYTTEPDPDDLPDAQMQLKTMVEAIAAASQREAEAHETAIALAKENDELRMQLEVFIEHNKRLVELYEPSAEENTTGHSEKFPIIQVGYETQRENDEELDVVLRPSEEDRKENFSNQNIFVGTKNINDLEHQLQEMHEENEKLMVLYEKAMQERDECKRMLVELNAYHRREEMITSPEKLVEVVEERCPERPMLAVDVQPAESADVSGVLHWVENKLKLAQEKLAAVQKTVKYFALLEKSSTIVMEEILLANVQVQQADAQLKQEVVPALKHSLSQTLSLMQEKRTTVENKLLSHKSAIWNLNSKFETIEEREVNARRSIDLCMRHLEEKKEALRCLRICKDDLSTSCTKAQQSETEMRSKTNGQKLKLQELEARRKETERVLLAIDNLDNPDGSGQKALGFGKASELLKSEEQRTRLLAEMKQSREHLSTVQKDITVLIQKNDEVDKKIESIVEEINNSSLLLQEAEQESRLAVQEKEILSETARNERMELERVLIDYQECGFWLDLKEEEIRVCEESVQQLLTCLDGLHAKQSSAKIELNELLQEGQCDCLFDVSERMEQELQDMQMRLTEAKTVLSQ